MNQTTRLPRASHQSRIRHKKFLLVVAAVSSAVRPTGADDYVVRFAPGKSNYIHYFNLSKILSSEASKAVLKKHPSLEKRLDTPISTEAAFTPRMVESAGFAMYGSPRDGVAMLKSSTKVLRPPTDLAPNEGDVKRTQIGRFQVFSPDQMTRSLTIVDDELSLTAAPETLRKVLERDAPAELTAEFSTALQSVPKDADGFLVADSLFVAPALLAVGLSPEVVNPLVPNMKPVMAWVDAQDKIFVTATIQLGDAASAERLGGALSAEFAKRVADNRTPSLAASWASVKTTVDDNVLTVTATMDIDAIIYVLPAQLKETTEK